MLTHLSVKDFQCIVGSDTPLAPVTLFCGHNMAGKSAILRALHSLCFNRTGDGFIRYGEEIAQASVQVDGTVVFWEKERKTSASYSTHPANGTIDDVQTFVKTGSSVPDPIVEALKIRRIEVDSTFSIAPQFKMQHDTLLIQESGSRLARILGSLTKLDVVVKAQMSCRKDRDRAKKDKEAAEQEALRLDEQVAELDWVPDARAKIDSINETLALAAQAAEKYEKVRRLIGERQRLQDVVQRGESVAMAAMELTVAAGLMKNLEVSREPARQYPRLVSAAGRTQAVQIAKTNLHGAGEQLRELSERKEGLILCGNSITSQKAASQGLSSAVLNGARARGELQTSEAAYRTACDEADLCDHCPLREGV